MSDKVCLPYFHFVLLLCSVFAFIIWAFYQFVFHSNILNNLLTNKNNFNNNNNSNYNSNREMINPDIIDDLAVGTLPPVRRDYRKMYDPLKEASRRYVNYPNNYIPANGVFNIPTQGYLPAFQMIGYMAKDGDADPMLKLFGRRRDGYRWDYYTTHYDDPSIKIPLKVDNDKELMEGDELEISGFKGKYHVNLYDYESPTYIPII